VTSAGLARAAEAARRREGACVLTLAALAALAWLPAGAQGFQRGSGEAAGVTAGSIRRIEAMGNVFLSSPEETAQGDFGVYDVDGGLLTLEGSVVLTRDENVVRGERLEIELATGRSQMFAAVPSTAGGTPGQRVKAVFVPPPEPVEPAAGPAGDASSGGGPGAAQTPPSPPKATQ
jgi:LptA/(LptD N-terminal domain) LPS transport protein